MACSNLQINCKKRFFREKRCLQNCCLFIPVDLAYSSTNKMIDALEVEQKRMHWGKKGIPSILLTQTIKRIHQIPWFNLIELSKNVSIWLNCSVNCSQFDLYQVNTRLSSRCASYKPDHSLKYHPIKTVSSPDVINSRWWLGNFITSPREK